MSFTDRHNSIIIGTGTLITGTLTKILEEPNLSNEGWDTMQVTYVQRIAGCTAEECAALFPIGAQLGSRKWWITGAKPFEMAPGFWRFVVDFKGWAEEKPIVVRVSASANQQSGQNILAPAYVGDTVGAVYAKVETHENLPDLTVSYLVDDIVADSLTESVGTQVDPPVEITGIDVPPTVWAFLTEFVYHWPNGWVLMQSAQDRLPGTTAAHVTDSYKYIREETPG